MTLQAIYQKQGATLAGDGIPLHFGDIKGEYTAALETAVLLDRHHEGRISLGGKDRFDLPNRMSTNHLLEIPANEARPTLFTNANGRIIDRAVAANWRNDSLLMMSGPGRGAALTNYIQRNVFFGDDVQVKNLESETHQFNLHGPAVDAIMAAFLPDASDFPVFKGKSVKIGDEDVYALRLKPYAKSHWVLISSKSGAASVWEAVTNAGANRGLRASGGVVFNALRIRSGVPGTGRELSDNYIPLELGLWDEVSFNKGCYTGQEIIARMESRGRLAKTLVGLTLSEMANAPADLFADGKRAGTLTSSVTAPDGVHYGIGVLKPGIAVEETTVQVGAAEGPDAIVTGRLGVQPEWISDTASS